MTELAPDQTGWLQSALTETYRCVLHLKRIVSLSCSSLNGLGGAFNRGSCKPCFETWRKGAHLGAIFLRSSSEDLWLATNVDAENILDYILKICRSRGFDPERGRTLAVIEGNAFVISQFYGSHHERLLFKCFHKVPGGCFCHVEHWVDCVNNNDFTFGEG